MFSFRCTRPLIDLRRLVLRIRNDVTRGGGSACCFRQKIVDYVESVTEWPDFAMESPELIKNLQARVKELENELKCLKSSNSAAKPAAERRGKIAEMSSEVVDSNPYRFGFLCDSRTHDVTDWQIVYQQLSITSVCVKYRQVSYVINWFRINNGSIHECLMAFVSNIWIHAASQSKNKIKIPGPGGFLDLVLHITTLGLDYHSAIMYI